MVFGVAVGGFSLIFRRKKAKMFSDITVLNFLEALYNEVCSTVLG